MICDYTEHMEAVDRSHHYCTSYSFTRKTLKWWRKLFFWLLEVCFVNSFILYKQAIHAASFRQLTYRQRLVEQLVGNVRNERSKKRGRPSSLDSEEKLNKQQHFIAKAARGHNKDCMVCSKPQSWKATLFYCETCVRKPGLHLGACFKAYYTQRNYKQQNCLLPPYLCFHFPCFLTYVLPSLSLSPVYVVLRIQLQNKKCN